MSGGTIFLGGSGFLGRAMIAHLAEQGQATAAVVRSREAGEKVRAVSQTTRILLPDEIDGTRYDRLFNMVVDYGRGEARLAPLIETNLLFPLRLIERIDCDRVINVSTGLPGDFSHYAHSKKALEDALNYLAERTGRRAINIHLHNFYGPGTEETNLVTFLMTSMLRGKPLELGTCENSRDFIYIDDLVECLDAVSTRFDEFACREPVPVGSGAPTKLKDLVFAIRDLVGSDTPIRFGARPDNPREPAEMFADMTPVSRTGWRPKISLAAGLTRTLRSLSAA